MPHFEYCIDCSNKFNNLEEGSHFFRCKSCQKKYARKRQREQDEIAGYRIRQKREQRRRKLRIILKPIGIFRCGSRILGFCYRVLMCIFCLVLSTYLITCPFEPGLKTFHIFAAIGFCSFSVGYITENIGELLKMKTGGSE